MLFARSEFNVDKEHPQDWYLKATQAGLPAAQFMLGINMLDVVKDSGERSKGMVWLQKAADHGSPEARLALAYDTLSQTSDGRALAAAQATFDGLSNEEGADSRNCRISAKFYLAALLAAGPDGVQLDAARALTLVEDVRRDMHTNPIMNEIRAAAYAGLGKFDDAQQSENKALGMAKRLGWNTAPLESRLAAYQKNQAWRGNFFLP